MAQLRYECSHCTKLSCNHTAATQHSRDAHGGQANILPERSKAQMRANDFAQRAEIASLRADLANAGAVMVEAALRLPAYDSDGDPAGQFDHHVFVRRDDLRALSTLSPIAAAAGVLLADKAALQIVAQSIAAESGPTVDVLRHGLLSLAEQEKADG